MRWSTPQSMAPYGSLAARQGAAMAHRRRIMRGRQGLAALVLVLVTAVLAAAVHVTNEVTTLRRHIVKLEAQRRVSEAERACLLSEWNAATSLPVLVERAQKELGLEVATEPGLTLVAVRHAPGRQPGRVQRFLGGLGSAGNAHAAEVRALPEPEPMVSLAPLRRPAGGAR